jgi:hypothetical protein
MNLLTIPKSCLKEGAFYVVEARTFIPLANGTQVALWDGKNFVFVASEFGFLVTSYELHWEDNGTVKPLRLLN